VSGVDLLVDNLSTVSHLVVREELVRTSTLEMGGDVFVLAQSSALRDLRS